MPEPIEPKSPFDPTWGFDEMSQFWQQLVGAFPEIGRWIARNTGAPRPEGAPWTLRGGTPQPTPGGSPGISKDIQVGKEGPPNNPWMQLQNPNAPPSILPPKGMKWQWSYFDSSGKPLPSPQWVPMSAVDGDMPMSAYEKARVDLANRKFDWDQKEVERKAKSQELMTQAKIAEGNYNQIWLNNRIKEQEDERRVQAREREGQEWGGSIGQRNAMATANLRTFEDMRSQLLSQLTGPRDWITRWQVANKMNPYVNLISAIGGGDRANITQPTAMPIPQQLGNWVPSLKGKTTLMPWTEGEYPPGGSVETPSGQQMASTTKSEQQMVGGYADWAGENWEDILQYGKMMLPNDPSRGQRWTPRRQ